MKVVILAGGYGTRLAEETYLKPKPMVEIGGKPLLWHIMKLYASFGHKDFIIAMGYKSEVIKQYFINYHLLNNNFSINLGTGETELYDQSDFSLDWKVTLIDTGLNTPTGGRLKALEKHLNKETFMLTYGDGLADINIKDLASFHKQQNKIATISAVRPPSRFGGITLDGHKVTEFIEKSQVGEGWINGGFMVFEPEVFNYLSDTEPLESSPMEKLVSDEQLVSFCHTGFWQPMDTVRERNILEELWLSNNPPWKLW